MTHTAKAKPEGERKYDITETLDTAIKNLGMVEKCFDWQFLANVDVIHKNLKDGESLTKEQLALLLEFTIKAPTRINVSRIRNISQSLSELSREIKKIGATNHGS